MKKDIFKEEREKYGFDVVCVVVYSLLTSFVVGTVLGVFLCVI